MMQKEKRVKFLLHPFLSFLDNLYVFSLGAFLPLGHIELNALTFGQSSETRTTDCTEMNEHIGTVVLLNKTKTLGFVEPFNAAS